MMLFHQITAHALLKKYGAASYAMCTLAIFFLIIYKNRERLNHPQLNLIITKKHIGNDKNTYEHKA